MKPEEIRKLVINVAKELDDIDVSKCKEIGRGLSSQEYTFIVYHDQAPLTPKTKSGEDITIVDMYDGCFDIIFYIRTHLSVKDIKNYLHKYEDTLIPE